MVNKESTDGCLLPLFGFSFRLSFLVFIHRQFLQILESSKYPSELARPRQFPEAVVHFYAHAGFKIGIKLNLLRVPSRFRS